MAKGGRREILEAASIADAKYLLVTVPDVLVRTLVILAARELNGGLRVFARARYLKERAWLEEVGATEICIEEAKPPPAWPCCCSAKSAPTKTASATSYHCCTPISM